MLLRAVLGILAAAAAGTAVAAVPDRPAVSVVRVTSATPGQQVQFRGILLRAMRPMQMIEKSTPYQFRADSDLAFAAFEAAESGMLRLEVVSATPESAVIIGPRVMVGHRIGGVATEFVQGY